MGKVPGHKPLLHFKVRRSLGLLLRVLSLPLICLSKKKDIFIQWIKHTADTGYKPSFISFLVASLRIQPWAHLGKSTQAGEAFTLPLTQPNNCPPPLKGSLESADKEGFYNSSDPHSLYFTDKKLRCNGVKWLVKPFAPLWRGSLRFPLFLPVRHDLLLVLGWEC